MKPLRSKRPAHSILSPAFRYTPSAQTNVALTFARARRALAARPAPSNVKPIKRSTTA